MGTGDAKNASHLGEIIALCDVDEKHVAKAAEQFTKDGKTPAKYNDFRKVMERDDVHVILTGTPDHWHTLVNLAATQAGKDVYGEKPLTLTIDEGKHLVRLSTSIRRFYRQEPSSEVMPAFGWLVSWFATNALGQLKEVTVWLPAGLREGPFTAKPVPPELNWDFWLGQAPKGRLSPASAATCTFVIGMIIPVAP
jgi:hypothetical protein